MSERLTNDATDPVSGMPEFKVCAVDVTAALPHPAHAPETLEEVRA